MSIAASMLPEFDHEFATTRKFLERIPEDKFDFAPHPKSMTLTKLAAHVAEIASWVGPTIALPELDLAGYVAPVVSTRANLLSQFDADVAAAREVLAATEDPTLFENWTLKMGDSVFFSMPKIAVLRSFVMNHMIHHRAQLGVYLRLLDVPVPGAYGPSADEA